MTASLFSRVPLCLTLFFPYLFAFLVFFKISLASLLSDALTRGFPFTFFPLSIFLSLYEIFWKDFLHVIFFPPSSSVFLLRFVKRCSWVLHIIFELHIRSKAFFGSQKFCHCYCVVDSQHNISSWNFPWIFFTLLFLAFLFLNWITLPLAYVLGAYVPTLLIKFRKWTQGSLGEKS